MVRAVELRLAGALEPGALDQLTRMAPGVEVFAEVRPGDASSERPAALAAAGVRAKLRCGGLGPSEFPSIERPADFVSRCTRHGVRFKATAGLHSPIAYWDPGIGVRRHGFLNLWAATAAAHAGTGDSAVRACLSLSDPQEVQLRGRVLRFGDTGLSLAALARARQSLVAFGTCSIAEPLEGLRAMGLLAASGADD